MAADSASIRARFSGISGYDIQVPSRQWYTAYLDAVRAVTQPRHPWPRIGLRTRLPGSQRRILKVHKVFFHHSEPPIM